MESVNGKQWSHDMNGAILMDTVQHTPNGAKQTLQILHEISAIMRTDLDVETLAICYRLLENGVNAQSLAKLIETLRSECLQVLHSNHSNE